MGKIRKTLSIGTLGLVSFRSKSEKLKRAESAMGSLAESRDLERVGRVEAQTEAATARSELKRAKRDAVVARRRVSKLRKRRDGSRTLAGIGDAATSAVRSAEPVVRSGVESARELAQNAAAGGRRVGRRANEASHRAKKRAAPTVRNGAESAQHLGHDVAVTAKKVGRRGNKAATRVQATVTDRAQQLADSTRTAVSEVLDR